MSQEYRMDITIVSAQDEAKVFQDVIALLETKGIVIREGQQGKEGEARNILFSVTPEEGHEREIADVFKNFSKKNGTAVLRVGYEESESGAYGYGVLQNGMVLDSFWEERQERASPLAEQLRSSILEGRVSFEEAYRRHEPKLDRQSGESIHLMLGWNSCKRVVEGKANAILEERMPNASREAEVYGMYFRKFMSSQDLSSSERLERLDEEIARSMLRVGYRTGEIAQAIQNCSPKAQVFIKPRNLETYAKGVLQAAQREQRSMGGGR